MLCVLGLRTLSQTAPQRGSAHVCCNLTGWLAVGSEWPAAPPTWHGAGMLWTKELFPSRMANRCLKNVHGLWSEALAPMDGASQDGAGPQHPRLPDRNVIVSVKRW